MGFLVVGDQRVNIKIKNNYSVLQTYNFEIIMGQTVSTAPLPPSLPVLFIQFHFCC